VACAPPRADRWIVVTGWLINFVNILFQVLSFAIIARALLSWFNLGPTNPLVRILYDVTEPILAPLRRVIPTFGMIDITPIVAYLLLQLAQGLLVGALVRGL
jgi:YggT family protein